MLFGDRRHWRYLVVPWLWSSVAFAILVAVGYVAFVPWLQTVLIRPGGEAAGPLRFLVAVAYFVVWVYIAGFVFLTLTAVASSFLWEKLSVSIEEKLTGRRAPACTLSKGRLIGDSVSRGTFAIFMSLLSLVVGWFVPVLGPVVLAGWVGLMDYTAPAFLRYGRTVGAQWPMATRMKGWFGFQLTAGLLTLLPVVNVLFLPVMVAGGTVMAVRSGVLKPETRS